MAAKTDVIHSLMREPATARSTPAPPSPIKSDTGQHLQFLRYFCGSIMSIKIHFAKKWSKTPIPALSSGPSNLQQSIWGRHHQLKSKYQEQRPSSGRLTTYTVLHSQQPRDINSILPCMYMR